jgi:ribulose-phosphate 3-epimerase
MKKICPSILSADFSKLKEEIKEVESAGADIIHCDIMDGNFVPNISFGYSMISAVNKITELPLDVHLMINNPDKYVKEFRDAGADFISVHYENNVHLNSLISQIKKLGAKAGVVINPSTPVSLLIDILEYVDFVLIMSVNPGFGGQKFIESVIPKIIQLKTLIQARDLDCLLEIDGGIDLDNIKQVSDAGADMFVCGASVFKSDDKTGAIKKLKELIS